jgi:hypothetical protein
MKTLVMMILVGLAGYFGYQHFNSDDSAAPDVIDNPVYADMRLDMQVGGRDLQFALFGKMASQADCDQRSKEVWGKVIEGCKECIQRTSVCKTELEPRYQRLFENTAIHSTYISFTHGSAYERDGRMVIFGLTADEGDAICEQTRSRFGSNYSGTIECVRARRD